MYFALGVKMIGGIYHPLYDPYYCSYRMLGITIKMANGIEPEVLNILDFYSLFPQLLVDFDVKSNKSLRKLIKKLDLSQYPFEYGALPESTVLFQKLNLIQKMALRFLLTKNILQWIPGDRPQVLLGQNRIPDALMDLIQIDEKRFASLSQILGEMATIPLRGAGGLKQRSALMDYRYDQTN